MNNWRGLSKHYDYHSGTGEAKILLASIYYLSKRLTCKKMERKIDHDRDERLRKPAEKASKKLPNLPKLRRTLLQSNGGTNEMEMQGTAKKIFNQCHLRRMVLRNCDAPILTHPGFPYLKALPFSVIIGVRFPGWVRT